MKPSTQKMTNAVYKEVTMFAKDKVIVSRFTLFLIGLYEAKAMRPVTGVWG